MAGARLLFLTAALVTPGCITGTYTTWRTHREVQGDDTLQVGVDDLESCLARLGAPLVVRENGAGILLAWGWAHEREWGLTASIPVTDQNSASFSYNDADLGLTGLALFFDSTWTLTAIRRGLLADVLPPSQTRALSLDELEAMRD